jgi:hypothetical protein
MDPSTKMIGQVFRDALARKIETLPLFLRPQLAPVLGLLNDWVATTEDRLALIEGQVRGINKMPSPEVLESICAPLALSSTCTAPVCTWPVCGCGSMPVVEARGTEYCQKSAIEAKRIEAMRARVDNCGECDEAT